MLHLRSHRSTRSHRHLVVELLECRNLLAALRVVNWNTLDRPNNQTQINQFSTILSAIGAENVGGTARPIDLIALQETSPQRANNVEAILEDIAGDSTGDLYESVTIGNGPEDYVGFAYNTDVLELLATTSVSGSFTHEPLRAHFRPIGTSGDADFYAYSIHLKAGNSSSDQSTRTVETAALRNNANGLGNGTQVMFLGDFNMRSSNETAFNSFVTPGNAQLFDPINRLGNWHNNFSFRDIHTQNPQNNPNGGFMDDRFDLQLLSGEFFDGQGIDYTSGSYRAFGNNGTHNLNGPITSGSGASPSVLNALALASDHLPVVADYEFTPGIPIRVDDIVVDEIDGTATFTISADSAPASAITVQYATQNGSATAGSDFQAANDVATILPTETSTTVVVDLIDDTDEEPDETFFLNLFNPSVGALIEDGQALATIRANDAVAVTFGFGDAPITVPQGTSEVTVQFVLSGNAPGFDAITYAIGIGDGLGGGGTGTAPSFASSPTLIGDISGWNHVPQLPTPQIVFGNINAPAGSGDFAALPNTVFNLTIDTSQSVAGDSWTLNANLQGLTNASLALESFDTIAANTTINIVPSATVVDRHLFYNNTSYDGGQPGPGVSDDNAIDESKSPLTPGNTASFANYSGFTGGINGIMIDVDGLSAVPVPTDFSFAVGNDSDPSNWTTLTTPPSIDVRAGEGTNGSDRITLIWPDETIVDQWIEIQVLTDGPNSIVTTSDTFYFGNSRGEVGAGNTRIDASDAGAVSSRFTSFFDPDEPVTNQYDVNKSGRVNAADFGAVSSNFTPFFGQELQLISPPAAGSSVGFAPAMFIEDSSQVPSLSFSLISTSLREPETDRPLAVDLLMKSMPARKATSFGETDGIRSTISNPSLVDLAISESPDDETATAVLGTILNRNSIVASNPVN